MALTYHYPRIVTTEQKEKIIIIFIFVLFMYCIQSVNFYKNTSICLAIFELYDSVLQSTWYLELNTSSRQHAYNNVY